MEDIIKQFSSQKKNTLLLTAFIWCNHEVHSKNSRAALRVLALENLHLHYLNGNCGFCKDCVWNIGNEAEKQPYE